MIKITTTRVTSTVVLTGQLVHVDGELLVDEPVANTELQSLDQNNKCSLPYNDGISS